MNISKTNLPLGDVYFFTENYTGAFNRASPDSKLVVPLGSRFGIVIKFNVTLEQSFGCLTSLKVPHSPERFPSSAGETIICEDCRTVYVRDHTGTGKTFLGFYWDLGFDDPVGLYIMSIKVEGMQLASYKFDVSNYITGNRTLLN